MTVAPKPIDLSQPESLETLLELGVLDELSYHFAHAMARLLPEPASQEVLLALAFSSRAISLGHVCTELKLLASSRILDRTGNLLCLQFPDPEFWVSQLAASPLVSLDRTGHTPLVLDRPQSLLYLTRYWVYQQQLVQELGARAKRFEQVDGRVLTEGLDRYFPDKDPEDHQRLAALIGLVRNFTVISGGPGTGKTSTVTKILAVLLDVAQASDALPPRILLLAPTGKASARLGESIKNVKSLLMNRYVLTAEQAKGIPEVATTIHRALGWVPHRPTRFNHNAHHRLAADVVLVDEASMVDLGLLAKLVCAVPDHARLIFLGDKDQLASVEAGAILGDIIGGERAKPNHYSQAMAGHVAQLSGDVLKIDADGPQQLGIWDSMVHLTKSYRFNETSAIGLLAKDIQAGKGDAVVATLTPAPGESVAAYTARNVRLVNLDERDTAIHQLKHFIEASFRPYLEAGSPEEALHLFDNARLLCAHRQGEFGVEFTNRFVEAYLGELNLIHPRELYYSGRPVMVTRNDAQLNLFNGDIGLIRREGTSNSAMVYFPTKEGKARALAPGHLPPHETVYAMTVHKSQGSEFDSVALLLPPEISPIITRELIYTAVTRAKKRVTLFGNAEVLTKGIKERITRASGLSNALWKNDSK